jgi:hypothetical protein
MAKDWVIRLRTLASTAMAAALMTLPLAAQQTAQDVTKGPSPNLEEFQRRVRPAEQFEILSRFVGNWEGNLTAWIHGQPLKQARIKDVLAAKWILKDSFLDTQFALTIGDTIQKGRVTMGYNASTHQFFRILMGEWDPRGTSSTGVYVRSKNALAFEGTDHSPITGDTWEKREIFTFLDKDKIAYEQVLVFADGTELKAIEGHYTRMSEK